ncbi:MAG TPA: hypothetical protein VGF56_07330 [Rhizomicrobium sp.]|jgi:hypothetical protein
MTELVLYLAGSVIGIALMVGLNLLLFGRGVRALDPAALAERLALDHPGFRAGASVVAGDAALIENLADGAVWLVRAGGDKFVTRRVVGLKRLSRAGTSLDLRFADFTFPRARLCFADEATARSWEARLRP